VQFTTLPPFEECFPGSSKLYRSVTHGASGEELRVPFRRVQLSEGAPAPGYVDLYDTSGPQHHAPVDGLPKLRAPWVARRAGDAVCTQARDARATAPRVLRSRLCVRCRRR
jgi:phosphomethylpyrimidine synthase